LLTDVVFTISTRDIEDADASKEVRDFKLDDNAESTFEFQVPANLQQLTFTLTAKVKTVSTGATNTVTASQSMRLNLLESESEFRSVFLRRLPAPRHYELMVLGKTGEPIKDYPFSLYVKPKFLNSTKTFSLQTDKAGVCSLGELRDVEYIQTYEPRSWRYDLQSDVHSMPQQVHALEGGDEEASEIQIPFILLNGGGEDKVERSHVALFELRNSGSAIYADHFDKISYRDGLLRIKNLPAGQYELYIKVRLLHTPV
jgi:hypothetical protein